MKEGEKRVIIVPPALGYSDNRPGVNGIDLRDETLRYDVEITGL
jgi:FKBP-type peptidyl-prolyl cis-trans isomerase